jgi:hypothetical protein
MGVALRHAQGERLVIPLMVSLPPVPHVYLNSGITLSVSNRSELATFS